MREGVLAGLVFFMYPTKRSSIEHGPIKMSVVLRVFKPTLC